MLLIKNVGHIGFISNKKSWGGCHHLLLVYDASKYCVCSEMTSFQPSEGIFSEKLGFFSNVKIFKNAFNEN